METMMRPFKRMRMDEPEYRIINKRRIECVSGETNEIINNKCPRISNPAFFVNLFAHAPKKALKRKFQEPVNLLENIHKFRRTEIKSISAVKIQKIYRGWKCRYRIRKTAATKIQRIYRGWICSRKFHIRKFHFYN